MQSTGGSWLPSASTVAIALGVAVVLPIAVLGFACYRRISPYRMDINLVHPDIRSAVQKIPSIEANNDWLIRSLSWLSSRSFLPKPIPGTTVEKITGLPGGDTLVLKPTEEKKKTKGCLLWIHGGGFIIGGPSVDAGWLLKVCLLFPSSFSFFLCFVVDMTGFNVLGGGGKGRDHGGSSQVSPVLGSSFPYACR